ncbi:hypothetical protein BOTBODRAFT_589939 [Botryobasidium botryosum FD-172 SS1]|uniref:F-box domain-containing protein n=1 Tax=Botryobasidium botryosum (strain FD-172 SS1) TaxID=930990 RepID=A0A067LXN4_BOTB1|nr:hypothetical protein BOTBODRAFT_589939 [Botryobasidium botryosum FD-172 SS1]
MIIRRTVLSKMDQLFPYLERLDMRCTDVSPIRIFRITRLLTNLRELYLNAENCSQANWSREDAVAILTQGPIHLRCVRVDRKQWVKKWTPSPFRHTTEEIPWPGCIEVIEETVDRDIWDDCDQGIRPGYLPPFFAN